MIEATDEMINTAAERIHGTQYDLVALRALRDALTEVLAIVERDYRLDRICRAELMPGVHCARPAHVRGEHEGALPGGSAVKWS